MIQVIHRAFDILEFVAAEPNRPKSLTEVAEAAGLNPGTCANIMKTMVSRRYLDQVGPKKGYCLGSQAYWLTGNTSYRKDILETARPEMAGLTARLNESCLLSVLNGDQRLIIHRELCDQPLQVQTANEKHAYDSASGRLLVSLLNDADLVKFKNRYGLPTAELWEEATSEPAFYSQIKAVRDRGYAFQESTRQVIGYGVGVFRQQEVVASLSVYLPLYRHTPEKAQAVLHDLQRTAQVISQSLTGG
ncbi:IclR family transcriptional regulator [Spirosoma montaniterrae]|uniref:IclR family transcriptional regulator n=1 Tax=Spirosoma montaniterrae TaxID=1178516 RepID=A0A1P9WUX5_9BACT|nr:IclR family transcriptional regulator [Spirosoma montaniterrae]AQG79192.1 IclR family transcriptional regulator [Spirosoma montaniterrae]